MEKKFILKRLDNSRFRVGDLVQIKKEESDHVQEPQVGEVSAVDHPFLWIRFGTEPFSIRFLCNEVKSAEA